MPFVFTQISIAEKQVEATRKRAAGDSDDADADQLRPLKRLKTTAFVPKDLDVEPRYKTRYASKARSRVFPIFRLPRELRDLIYDFALDDPTGIDKEIDKYYKQITNTANIDNEKAPRFRRGTPTVFLINKQIYDEAFELLEKRTVTFTHGLLDLTRLSDFASPDLFANLGSIEINDSGHPIFQENIKHQSFGGYYTLICSLANCLANGHNLKSFNLTITSPEIASHWAHGPGGCWDRREKCGPRDSMRYALACLRNVRHIESVTFGGVLPVEYCANLKQSMESKPTSFFSLPLKVRERIYAYTIDTNRVTRAIKKEMSDRNDLVRRDPTSFRPSFAYPQRQRHVENVFKICSQISAEARVVSLRKGLTIQLDEPGFARQVDLLRFVGAGVFFAACKINLIVNSSRWAPELAHVFTLLATHRENSKLQMLNIHFKDADKYLHLDKRLSRAGLYPHHHLVRQLSGLLHIRGVRANFTGDLPPCWWRAVASRMYQPRDKDQGQNAPPRRLLPIQVHDMDYNFYPVEILAPAVDEPAVFYSEPGPGWSRS